MKKFIEFNINLFFILNLALLIYSITRGKLGIINFIAFLLINIIILTVYLISAKRLESTRKNLLFGVIFLVLLLSNLFLSFISLTFLRDALSMNYKITEISFSLVPFFMKNILGLEKLILFFGIVGLASLTSLILVRKRIVLFQLENNKKLFWGIILVLLIILRIIFDGTIYNPYALLDVNSNNIILNVDHSNSTFNGDFINHKDNFNSYNFENKQYRYVFVFVMEQTSLGDFYREKSYILEGSDFFEKLKENTHFYTNYYTSNQDSRTAIWEMFSSFLIPIECYVEPWQDYYGYVLDLADIISNLKNDGVQPYSVSSVGGGSLILGAYDFNHFIRMYNFEKEKQGYLCYSEFSYQKACEDLALFDEFTKHIRKNKENDLFYFQELIFGHGEEYMQKSGKSRVEYYNDYFNKFYMFLEDEEIVNDSLIIIVSDHGPKGGKERVVEDFNIPLIIISNKLDSKGIESYYSHLSFKDIFLSYYLNTKLPPEEKLIYLIDQSGRSKRGYIDVEKNISIMGELKGEKFRLDKRSVENINLIDVQEKIINLLDYEEYVKKQSTENHTYVYIP